MTFGGTRYAFLTCFCPLRLEGRRGEGKLWCCRHWGCLSRAQPGCAIFIGTTSSSSASHDFVFQRLTTLLGLWTWPELGILAFQPLEWHLWNTTPWKVGKPSAPCLWGTQTSCSAPLAPVLSWTAFHRFSPPPWNNGPSYSLAVASSL